MLSSRKNNLHADDITQFLYKKHLALSPCDHNHVILENARHSYIYDPNYMMLRHFHKIKQNLTATSNSLNSRLFTDSLALSCFSSLGVLRAAKAFLYTPQQSINKYFVRHKISINLCKVVTFTSCKPL